MYEKRPPRKRGLTVLLLLLTLSLSACSGSGWSWVTDSGVEIAPNQVSDSYLADSDFQYYWSGEVRAMGTTTAGNGGYYIYDNAYSGNTLLLYCDAGTGAVTPLCSRPNCKHDSEDCSAWFGGYYIDRIEYASGALYLMGSSDEDAQAVNLYRISPDGQQRELVTTLFRAEGAVVSYQALIHRGCVYYCIAGQDRAEIIRVRLDGTGEAETIYAEDDRPGSEVSMIAYGNYLYIQDIWYTDKSYETINSRIGRCCIQTGEYQLLKEDAPYDFAVSETTLYYQDWDRTMALDLTTGEERVLYDSGIPVYLSFDGEHLFLDNGAGIFLLETGGTEVTEEQTLTVLDTDGTVLSACSVETWRNRTFQGGDGKHCFCTQLDTPESPSLQIYRCTVESLLRGTPEWVAVDVS